MVSVRGVVDLAQPATERHLRRRVEVQPPKHKHAVVFQRLEYRFAQQVVRGKAFRVQSQDLRPDRCGELVDCQPAWWSAGPRCPRAWITAGT